MPARFVWPPKGTDQPARPLDAAASVSGDTRARATDLGSARSVLPSPQASSLLQIERTWLGLTAPPLPIRMAEAGWAPDPWTLYCQRCGHSAGPHDADDTGCSACRKGRLPWDRLIRLGEYEGLLREMVHEVKFQRWRRLGNDLGELLGRAVGESLDRGGIRREAVAVVPVPTSWRRRTFRGIDHALVIARGVASVLEAPILSALTRSHRPSQTSLPRSDRLANVSGAFRLRPMFGSGLDGRVLVLVDDVTTTRSTLRAAARALAPALKSEGANASASRGRVWAAVLAVTPENSGKKRANGPGARAGMNPG